MTGRPMAFAPGAPAVNLGAKQVSIGELVGKGTPTLLATMSTLDPIWIYCNVSEVGILNLDDFDRTLGADDMKVELDAQRRVVAMSKQLARWDAGYVGMTFIPAARRGPYLEAVAATRAASMRESRRCSKRPPSSMPCG